MGDLFHADWKGSNHAANEILDLIGGEELANDLLRTYGFNQSHIEYIPESGRTPGSQTSARDLTNFWRKTFNKELPYSDQMLQYLIARSHPMLSSDNLFYDSQFEVYGTGGKNYGARSGTLAIEEQDGTTYFLTMLIQDKSAKETNFLGNYRLWKEIKTQEIRQPTEWFVNTHIKSKYNLNNHRSSLTECR